MGHTRQIVKLVDYEEDTHNITCDIHINGGGEFRIHCYTIPAEKLYDYDGWIYQYNSTSKMHSVASFKTTEIFQSGRLAFISALQELISKIE